MKRPRTVVLALVAATLLGGTVLAFANSLTVSSEDLTVYSTPVSVPQQQGNLSSVANQPTATPGSSITATATLANLVGTPSGTITFHLVHPAGSTPTGAECTAASSVGTKSVTANGNYTSDAVTAPAAGSYWWYVTYDGDANNAAAQGACGDNGDKVVVAASQSTVALHVASITLSSKDNQNRNFWHAVIEVTIVDSSNQPVSGVSVAGSWSPSSGAVGTCTATTNASGKCTIDSGNNAFPAATTSETWTVSTVSKTPGFTYNPSANSMSSITVTKP